MLYFNHILFTSFQKICGGVHRQKYKCYVTVEMLIDLTVCADDDDEITKQDISLKFL